MSEPRQWPTDKHVEDYMQKTIAAVGKAVEDTHSRVEADQLRSDEVEDGRILRCGTIADVDRKRTTFESTVTFYRYGMPGEPCFVFQLRAFADDKRFEVWVKELAVRVDVDDLGPALAKIRPALERADPIVGLGDIE